MWGSRGTASTVSVEDQGSRGSEAWQVKKSGTGAMGRLASSITSFKLNAMYKSRKNDFEIQKEHLPKSKWEIVAWSAVVSVVLMIAGVIILIVSGTMGSNKGKQIYEELNSTWNGTGLYVALFWIGILLSLMFCTLSIFSVFVLFYQEMKMEWRRLGLVKTDALKDRKWTSKLTQKFTVFLAILFTLSVLWYVVQAAASWSLILYYHSLENMTEVPLSASKESLLITVEDRLRPVLPQLESLFPNVTDQEALATFCPSLVCVDLMAYRFIKSDECICNRTIIESVNSLSGEAATLYIVNLVGVVILLLASLVLALRCMLAAASIQLRLKHWEYMQPVLVATGITSPSDGERMLAPEATRQLFGDQSADGQRVKSPQENLHETSNLPVLHRITSDYIPKESIKYQQQVLDSYFPPVGAGGIVHHDVEMGMLGPSGGPGNDRGGSKSAQANKDERESGAPRAAVPQEGASHVLLNGNTTPLAITVSKSFGDSMVQSLEKIQNLEEDEQISSVLGGLDTGASGVHGINFHRWDASDHPVRLTERVGTTIDLGENQDSTGKRPLVKSNDNMAKILNFGETSPVSKYHNFDSSHMSSPESQSTRESVLVGQRVSVVQAYSAGKKKSGQIKSKVSFEDICPPEKKPPDTSSAKKKKSKAKRKPSLDVGLENPYLNWGDSDDSSSTENA
eukprot:jgi/Picsp_1/6270/NSC_03622-R1_---NA---